jgi:hypothetical protein
MEETLLISLICLAIYLAINWSGMLLHFLAPHVDKLPNFVKKPLCSCLPCMGGLYSFTILIVAQRGLNLAFAVTVLSVIGLNGIIALFIRAIEALEALDPVNNLPAAGELIECSLKTKDKENGL